MRREIPGIVEGSRPLAKEEEEVEILAKAFNMAAGDYFKRRVEYENAVKEGEKMRENGRNIVIISLILGILFIAGGVLSVALVVIGVAVIVAGVLFGYYYVSEKGEAKIRKFKNMLAQLVPDKRITFVSKLFLPFYLVPYSRGTMLFDGLGGGDDMEISLVNLQNTKIEGALSNLRTSKNRFDNIVGTVDVLETSYLNKYNESVVGEKVLEKEVLDSMEEVENLTGRDMWIENAQVVTLHRPEYPVALAITELYPLANEAESLPSIETLLDLESAKGIISELRGVETEAIGGDIIGVVENWRNGILGVSRLLERNIDENVGSLNQHYEKFSGRVKDNISRQVCSDCLAEQQKKDDWEVRYDLGLTILGMFDSSISKMSGHKQCLKCGYKLENEGVDTEICECGHIMNVKEPAAESPRLRAKAEIEEEIDADLLRVSVGRDKSESLDFPIDSKYFSKQLLWADGNWQCLNENHSQPGVKTSRFYNDVFAHTGGKLWDEMKQPILEKADEANRRAIQNRQKFKDQKLSLLPYNQMFTQLELEMNKLDLAREEAKGILSALQEVR